MIANKSFAFHFRFDSPGTIDKIPSPLPIELAGSSRFKKNLIQIQTTNIKIGNGQLTFDS